MSVPINTKVHSLVICGSAIKYFYMNPLAKSFVPNVHKTLLPHLSLFSEINYDGKNCHSLNGHANIFISQLISKNDKKPCDHPWLLVQSFVI